MNKTAIKKFAVWARKKLIKDITNRAGMVGISEKGIANPLPQSTQRQLFFDIGTKEYAEVSGERIRQREGLVKILREKEENMGDYEKAFHALIEEVAYTWFNRLIAIRFMEVNDYLPSDIRVLSSESSTRKEPDLVVFPFDAELEYTEEEEREIIRLQDENQIDVLFRKLFIKQCNALYDILPELFEKTDDYSELLLSLSCIDEDGVVYRLIHDVPEEDFNVEKGGQVEIIGWMYQYYISEKHDEAISVLEKKRITKEDIPAATQLFTTHWVVQYMVDNSLGRYWVERNPESKLAEKLPFFAVPKSGEISAVNEKIKPEELTFLDPCMGSGHILAYAFDVLMNIYREIGYPDDIAVKNIVQRNLYGLEIDRRAYQLAYFALMMKARQYDKNVFREHICHHLAVIEESNGIETDSLQEIIGDKKQKEVGDYLICIYQDAKEIGSLVTLEKYDYAAFAKYLEKEKRKEEQNLFLKSWFDHEYFQMMQLAKQAFIMSRQYSVVCTNPPYLNKFTDKQKVFINKHYKDYSKDLFSVFMYRNFDYCLKDGYSAFMTPFVWMFIKSYEKLREYILSYKSIKSLVQMEYSAFEEATVPICTFVLKNGKEDSEGLYFRLTDFKGGMEVQKEKVLEAIQDKDCGYFYEANASNFGKIPGNVIAYWISDNLLEAFSSNILGNVGKPRQGLATGDNNQFLRAWYEIDIHRFNKSARSVEEALGSKKKWFPYNKGGYFRKWYGNNIYVVNWEKDGYEIRNFKDSKGKIRSRPQNIGFYFKPCLSWSKVSSGTIAFRFYPGGFIFDVAGCCIFYKDTARMIYDFGLLNSSVIKVILSVISPTLNYEVGHIASLPIIRSRRKNTNRTIHEIVQKNFRISKLNWDSFETSWDFKLHPLVKMVSPKAWNGTPYGEINFSMESMFQNLKDEYNDCFARVKSNEEKLNRIFIDIYGLQDELTPEVPDSEVTVHRVFDRKEDIPESMGSSLYVLTKQDVIKSFISYAVGCMLGRYSLDVEGLAYAGGAWDSSRYKTFLPDEDNCIPITDEEYFSDDIVGRFVEFVRIVYGAEDLEENLAFIAEALGNKGKTSREIIRNYFLKDFMEDHIRIYQKRPIYWMFDSGKQNGIKALCYMHRWNKETIGNLQVNYLRRMQNIYEREIKRMQDIIELSKENREIRQSVKRKEKLEKQLKETREYGEKVSHLALSWITIDLDDGVKVNYKKVQTDREGIEYSILAKL